MFEEFKDCKRYTFEELRNSNYSQIPKTSGCYFVEVPKDMTLKILDTSTAIDNFVYTKSNLKFTGKDLENINNKCGKDKNILYIGKAHGKDGLKNRIKKYSLYGLGKNCKHKGGMIIWRVKDNSKLNVFWIECQNPEYLEAFLLNKYKNKYNMKYGPLANIKTENYNDKKSCGDCPRFKECSANK